MTDQWETGNYHIVFWSMTSKAEFISERPVQFLYMFHFLANLVARCVGDT